MNEQKWIMIGEVDIPIIIDEGGVRWFPLNRLCQRILQRDRLC